MIIYMSTDQKSSHYTQLSVLGEGTYGKAILSRMSKTKNLSVIKESKLGDLSDDQILEILILKGIQHKNIVRLKNLLKSDSIIVELERMDDVNLII